MAVFEETGGLSALNAELFAAIDRRDGDAALAAIAGGADINVCRRFSIPIDRERVPARQTPLMAAIAARDSALALRLLAVDGIDLEIDDLVEGRTALIQAARAGDLGLVATLLEAGASIEAETHDGRTALAEAIEAGHADVADRLLDSGLPRALEEPLCEAAYRGQRPIVRRLLDAGAAIGAPNAAGDSPLVAAAWGGCDDVLAELLARGADLGRDGPAALARAANAGKTSTVRFLADRGVPVDGRDGNGWTPLMLAAWQGNDETVACLLALGADKTIADGAGKTALDWAREGDHEGVVALLA